MNVSEFRNSGEGMNPLGKITYLYPPSSELRPASPLKGEARTAITRIYSYNPLSHQGRSVNCVIQFTKPNSIVNLRGYYSNKRNGIGSIAPPIPAPCTKVMKLNVIIGAILIVLNFFTFQNSKH